MTYALEIPASPAQRRLWAIEQDMPGSTLHNLNMEVMQEEALDPDYLRAALGDVITRHEALRTEFRLNDGVLHQAVRSPQPRIPLEYTDLTGQTAEAAQARYRVLRQELENTPFDLAAAPLLRVRQIRREMPGARGEIGDTLLFAMHHMVADAISAEVITSDLRHAYASRASGHAPDWAPPPAQYADYTAWLAERSRTPEAERDREHWRRHLADLEELDLTLGRPRHGAVTDRGAAISVDLDPNRVAEVTDLARAQRATVFSVLAGAFSYALSRVFGAAEVAIGMSTAGRPLPEVARTVGLFTERLVLRVDLRGRPTFRQLVERARNEVLTALEHDCVGFDEIVDAVAPPRRYGVAPLTQVSINLNSVIAAGVVRRAGIDTVRHDLALNLVDTGTTIEGALEFRHGVVDEAAARRVVRVFYAVLRAGLRDPDAPVDAVPVVDADELRRLHTDQDGGPRCGGGRSLLELVARWVVTTPGALAVDGPDHRLTYRELWDHVTDLAGCLARHGVTPGAETPVMVAIPRRAALPVCLLAIVAAGGVYVPVDAAAPPLFLSAVAETVGARLALVLPDSPMSPPPGVTAVPVDVSRPAPAADVPKQWRANPLSAAYILFTAGTTGRPKGVTVEHRNLLGYLEGMLALLKPPPGSVHLMVQAPTFDSSLTTLCGALASGGVLRLLSEDAARDPALAQRLLTAAPADYLKITPSHLAALLAAPDPAALRPRRALLLGGEAARHDFAHRLNGIGWKVIGHYGPTETTVGVLAHELTDGGPLVDTVRLGRPLPGVRVYVLDFAGNPAPPGCRGELYVAGDLVARGYAGSPGRTAEVFLPDPFATGAGARMYRTGDIVRRLPDGTFEFCGRRDRQVKVRGHRIEPTALEMVIASLPGVSDVAVVARDDRLVAYVVTGPPGASVQEIRAAAARRLPASMVPGTVVALAELPLTAAGKLDVAALPSPGRRPDGPDEPSSAFVAPATPTEELLARLWRSVLGVPRVSATDRFFEVGGDSIRAVYLVGVAASHGLRLAARDVFENQTIQSMAARLEQIGREEPLPVRAVRAGLAGAVAPTVVRLAVAGRRPREAPRAGLTSPPGPPGRPGVTVRWDGDIAELAADPLSCDDSALCDAAAAISGSAGQDVPDIPAEGGATATAITCEAMAGTVRLPLREDIAAALARDPGEARQIHDAYGTRNTDIAAAAVLHALAADPGRPPAAPIAAATRHPAILLADIGMESPERGGRRALPAAVQLPSPPAGGWQDPGTLLQATKAAIGKARVTCTAWTADALAERTPIPGLTLRLLPLPANARLIDPGTGAPSDHPRRRTTITFAGRELVIAAAVEAGTDGLRALADRVAGALELLVAHCIGTAPVYSPADFPEADLDLATLARLLERIGVDAANGGGNREVRER